MIKLERFVIFATCFDEPSGLVSEDGSNQYIFTSEASVRAKAVEMKEQYPTAEYVPYRLVPLEGN